MESLKPRLECSKSSFFGCYCIPHLDVSPCLNDEKSCPNWLFGPSTSGWKLSDWFMAPFLGHFAGDFPRLSRNIGLTKNGLIGWTTALPWKMDLNPWAQFFSWNFQVWSYKSCATALAGWTTGVDEKIHRGLSYPDQRSTCLLLYPTHSACLLPARSLETWALESPPPPASLENAIVPCKSYNSKDILL